MKKELIINTIKENKIIAVIRLRETDKLKKVVDSLLNGGIKIIELTMTIPNAIEQINKISEEFINDALIGAGSVLNSKTAKDVIDAGAKFVASPIFNEEVISLVHSYELPMIPGCFTPTEIINAHNHQADFIKVFPADNLGTSFIKSILAPMPQLKLIPTGGVTIDNAKDWLKAGCIAVGIGSALIDSNLINNNNYTQLTENSKKIVQNISV